MSKVSYLILSSFKIETKVLLKPQRGASGEPFINTITGDLLIKAFSLSSILFDLMFGELIIEEPNLKEFCLTLLTRLCTSAPEMRSISFLFDNRIQVGTDVMSNCLDISGTDSVSIYYSIINTIIK